MLLAGFNFPISEDLLMFISAVLASKYPNNFFQLLLGIYLGAYLSDLVSYWVGRKLGPKLWKIKYFARTITKNRIQKIGHHYEKYGIFTLIIGRFIPFGIRNTLFMTAGFSKMNFGKFALGDLTACTITTSVFFTLYFYLGEGVMDEIKRINYIIFIFFAIIILIYLIKKYFLIKSKK